METTKIIELNPRVDKDIMESTEIDETSTPTRDFHLIEGESRQLRSHYYQQLIKYTRQLIKTLNGSNVTPDLESYCYHQLFITRVEMNKVREAFFKIIIVNPEPTTDGPKSS